MPKPDKTTTEPADTAPDRPRRRAVSVPLSTVVGASVIAVLTVATVTLAGFLIAARGELSDRDARAAAEERAEQVATEYAVGASTVDFADFNSWVANLKSNTVPALTAKFDATAPKLQEVLAPLKWTSTATPLAATVAAESNGVYQVDVFVTVSSTNAQNPDGAQTTVTYAVSVDSRDDWKISDVGGMDGALRVK